MDELFVDFPQTFHVNVLLYIFSRINFYVQIRAIFSSALLPRGYVVTVRVQDRLTIFPILFGAFTLVHTRGLLYMTSHGFITILVDLYPLHRPPWLLCRSRRSH